MVNFETRMFVSLNDAQLIVDCGPQMTATVSVLAVENTGRSELTPTLLFNVGVALVWTDEVKCHLTNESNL